MMRVKREHFEVHKISLIFYFGCTVLITWQWIDLLNTTPESLDVFFVFSLPVGYAYYLLLAMWVASFRNIELDADGYRIRFFKYEKRYLWGELKEKQLVTVKWKYYKEAVVLSRRKSHRPKWMDARYYNWFRPFSYVIIFLEQDMKKGYGGIYSVDKKEFMENVEKWNIILEDGGHVHMWGDKMDLTYNK